MRTELTAGNLNREKLDYLLPQFEKLLQTQLDDREKLRTRAWQGVAGCAAIVTFNVKLVADNFQETHIAITVSLIAWTIRLIWIAKDLVTNCLLPISYGAPGEDPRRCMSTAFLDQSIESIMAVHAVTLGERIEYNQKLLAKIASSLNSFARLFFDSLAVPILLGLVVWLAQELAHAR